MPAAFASCARRPLISWVFWFFSALYFVLSFKWSFLWFSRPKKSIVSKRCFRSERLWTWSKAQDKIHPLKSLSRSWCVKSSLITSQHTNVTFRLSCHNINSRLLDVHRFTYISCHNINSRHLDEGLEINVLGVQFLHMTSPCINFGEINRDFDDFIYFYLHIE